MNRLIVTIFLSFAFLLFNGCSKSVDTAEFIEKEVLLHVDFAVTRGEVDDELLPNRYIVEVYLEGESDSPIVHSQYDSSEIALRLPVGVYDFCFWADCGAYDATNLQSVTLSNMTTLPNERVAFAESLSGVVVDNNFTLNVTLTRPVAKVCYINNGEAGLFDGVSVDITYKDVAASYNVLEQRAIDKTEMASSASYSATNNAFLIDYLIPTEDGYVDIDCQIDKDGSCVEKYIYTLPVEANVVTNITMTLTK